MDRNGNLTTKHLVSEDELQAYVDGQLPHEKRQRVEAYLGENPDEAERIMVYRKHNISLHGIFDPQDKDEDLNELPPEMAKVARELNREIRSSTPQRNRTRYYIAIILVLLAAIVIERIMH